MATKTYTPSIVDVKITIQDAHLTQQGFGTPIFITQHQEFDERVRAYSSLNAVADDFETYSNAYTAARRFFSQEPSPSLIKIGRRAGTYSGGTSNFDNTTSQLSTHTLTVQVPSLGTSTILTISAQDAEAEADMIARWVVDINANSSVNSVLTATSAGTVLTLTVDNSATVFKITASSNFTGTFTATESASNVITALLEEDSDFYFVTSDDHTSTFVTAMSSEVQALDKMYFFSTNDASSLAAVTDPLAAHDWTSLIADSHTVGLFHEDSSTFVECAYVGSNAPYDAGSVTWANLQLSGVQASRASVNGKLLTETQKNNLFKRNINFSERDAGIDFTRSGFTMSGEWIDVIRGVHWQTADISVSLKGLLLSQKGGKVSYDNGGIARVREVLTTSLQRGVNRNFLESFVATVPLVAQTSKQDRLDRILNNVTFTAILAGAIHEIVVRGTVTVGE